MSLKTAHISEKPYTECGYSINIVINDLTSHIIDNIQSIKTGIEIILENFPKAYQKKVRLGVHELLINAIEHGVLGIHGKEKYEIKRKGEFVYDMYLINKLKSYVNGTIVVHYTETDRLCRLVIADNGKGFDWVKMLTKNSDIPVDGMGLKLAQTVFHGLSFNDIGNEVAAVFLKATKLPSLFFHSTQWDSK